MNKYLTDELKKEIIDYYKSDLHSIKEGSIKFSLKTKTLWDFLTRHNISFKVKHYAISKEQLYQKFIIDNLSIKDCAIFFNCSTINIQKKFKKI